MTIFSDVFVFDIGMDTHSSNFLLERNQWSKIQGYQQGDKPQERFGHTAVVRKNLMYVFGGWNGSETLSDVQVLNMDSLTWITI